MKHVCSDISQRAHGDVTIVDNVANGNVQIKESRYPAIISTSTKKRNKRKKRTCIPCPNGLRLLCRLHVDTQ